MITPATGLESYNVKLTTYTGSGPVLRAGVRGTPVAKLQQYLALLGYHLAQDGIFGTETEDVVVTFQRSAGISTDGIVGKLTWDALAKKLGQNISVSGSLSSAATGEKLPSSTTSTSGLSVGVIAAVAAVLIGGTLLLSGD